jgi:hypothetical protein
LFFYKSCFHGFSQKCAILVLFTLSRVDLNSPHLQCTYHW